MSDNDRIVRCVIHPGIGVARVGNAREEFYLAPEVPGRPAEPGSSGYKTRQGEIKREGARFRVYGYDDDGRVVKELTADDGEIEWRVQVANRKAAWYQFHNAMDMKQYALQTTYRNGTYRGEQRRNLVIAPSPRTISGRGVHGAGYRFDDGYVHFLDVPIQVPLGEVRTDDAGRLVVLGGHGHSASADGSKATTFANNDGWYDDTSDGTVRATIRLAGRDEPLEAEPAMVAVTPPNYGQGLFGPVTMYDVVYDLFVRHGWIEAPERPSFWRDVYPIFARLVGNQWVNEGVFFLFGQGSPSDFEDPALLERLASPDPAHRELRQRYFDYLRHPVPPWDVDPGKPQQLPPPQPADYPPFYGDGFAEFLGTAIAELAYTPTQYRWLERWAAGDFETGEPWEPPARLEDLPLAEQPRALDRAPLEDCLGGPFHPGIELTWPLRVPRMWRGPFRLSILPEGEEPRDDFGPVLTPQMAVGPDGPLAANGPGTLTRWLGIPWQTDEASCLAGYDLSTYLPVPSFWAARVPNEVLSWGAYERASDRRLGERQRLKHFDHRQFWLRDLQGSGYQDRINNMVAEWHKIGIVSEQPGPPDHGKAGLPAKLWVETGRDPAFTVNDPSWLQLLRAEHAGDQRQTPADTEAARAETATLEHAADVEGAAARSELEAVHPRRRRTLRRDAI